MNNIFDLTGKVALVTGGNRGIGLGMARALASAGAQVEIWGSNAQRNEEALHGLSALALPVRARAVDVADEGQVVAGMAALLAEHGRVDTVIANAGVSGGLKRFVDLTEMTIDRVLSVNLKGVIWTLREGCRHMVERAKAGDPGGSLIAVSSLGGHFGMESLETYSASKGAVAALVRSLAVAHGRFGIRANSIAPGFIRTELNPNLDSDYATRHNLPRIPLGRWGTGDDCGGIAVYLASDASAYHTGTDIMVDGGYAVR